MSQIHKHQKKKKKKGGTTFKGVVPIKKKLRSKNENGKGNEWTLT